MTPLFPVQHGPSVPFELELYLGSQRLVATNAASLECAFTVKMGGFFFFFFLTAITTYFVPLVRWIVQPKWTGMPGEMPAIPRLELVTWLEIIVL